MLNAIGYVAKTTIGNLIACTHNIHTRARARIKFYKRYMHCHPLYFQAHRVGGSHVWNRTPP